MAVLSGAPSLEWGPRAVEPPIPELASTPVKYRQGWALPEVFIQGTSQLRVGFSGDPWQAEEVKEAAPSPIQLCV